MSDSCWICIGDSSDGHFIHPCKCKGSMRVVHVDCLNKWRKTNPQAYYKCTHCLHPYTFSRPAIINLLQTPIVLYLLSIICFIAAVYTAGYVVQNRSPVPPSDYLIISYLTTGGILVGFIGLLTLLIGPAGIILSHMNLNFIDANSYEYVTIIVSIFLCIGICNAFSEIYLIVHFVVDKCSAYSEDLVEDVE